METWSSCYSHLVARKQNAPQASFMQGMMLCIAVLSKPSMTWSSQGSTVGKWKENTKALFFLDMGKKTEKSVFFVSILLLVDPSKTIATENSSRIAKETIQEEICTILRLHSNYISHLHVRAEDPSYSAWLFPPDLFISYNFSFQRDPESSFTTAQAHFELNHPQRLRQEQARSVNQTGLSRFVVPLLLTATPTKKLQLRDEPGVMGMSWVKGKPSASTAEV